MPSTWHKWITLQSKSSRYRYHILLNHPFLSIRPFSDLSSSENVDDRGNCMNHRATFARFKQSARNWNANVRN